jgi:hypothetical protein
MNAGCQGLGDRAEVGGLVARIAELVSADLREAELDNAVVDRAVNVGPLDGAAALPGVVASAVDDAVDGLAYVCVGGDVGRVLAAQLQADLDEAAGGGGGIDAVPAVDRAREGHVIHARVRGDALAGGVIAVQGLEQAGRCARGGERARKMLAAER